MKLQKLLIVLTVVNLLMMAILFTKFNPVAAKNINDNGLQLLRGTGLEIVDGMGRIRTTISVLPPVVVDGKQYTETVLLRLIDSKGKPVVKLAATENGSGFNISNELNGGVQIIANDSASFVKIKDKNGIEKLIKP